MTYLSHVCFCLRLKQDDQSPVVYLLPSETCKKSSMVVLSPNIKKWTDRKSELFLNVSD